MCGFRKPNACPWRAKGRGKKIHVSKSVNIFLMPKQSAAAAPRSAGRAGRGGKGDLEPGGPDLACV